MVLTQGLNQERRVDLDRKNWEHLVWAKPRLQGLHFDRIYFWVRSRDSIPTFFRRQGQGRSQLKNKLDCEWVKAWKHPGPFKLKGRVSRQTTHTLLHIWTQWGDIHEILGKKCRGGGRIRQIRPFPNLWKELK